MKKPSKTDPERMWVKYRHWVKEQLKDWDPLQDRVGPDVYVPRYNGVKYEDVEGLTHDDYEVNDYE